MNDTITGRVGRILSAGINNLVDSLERAAPEAVMSQAINEIDEAIGEVRHELGQIIANKHLTCKRLLEVNNRHKQLEEQAQLAIEEGREDLAQSAVSVQLDVEAQIPVLEASLAEAAQSEREMEGLVVALQGRKREMAEELKQFVHSQSNAASPESGGVKDANTLTKVEQATAAFDRIMSNHSEASVRAGGNDMSNLAELESMSRANRVAERMQSLKANKV